MKKYQKVAYGFMATCLASVWLTCGLSVQWKPAALFQAIVFGVAALAILLKGTLRY